MEKDEQIGDDDDDEIEESEDASPVDNDDNDDIIANDASFFDLDHFVGGGVGGCSGGEAILFTHLLEYLYTDSCDFLREGKKIPPLPQPKQPPDAKKEDEWMFDAADLSKSAFSVLKGGGDGGGGGGKGKKEQKGGKKKGGGGGGNGKVVAGNPLEGMRSLTKRFGLKALSKQLEAVFLDEAGVVNKIRYKMLNAPKLKFERTKHKWAYDVILKVGSVCLLLQTGFVFKIDWFLSLSWVFF